MDNLYIPNVPSDLSLEDVISLSEIRIKLGKEIINYTYTKNTIKVLLNHINTINKFRLLDFGCGNGILSEVIKEDSLFNISELIGVDACEYATMQALNTYEINLNNDLNLGISASIFGNKRINISTSLFDNTRKLNLDDNYIDGIVSSFVMHFRVYDNQFLELFRVLKKGGVFVYNDYIYDKYPSHAKKTIRKLQDIGFTLLKEETEFFLEPKSNTLKPQRIIIFTK
ncbi:methyltransferase domain protein [Providencia rustigianii DSM 4541]|uniref:Methyltransferase domain protein n=4 Tax=Providencia rustigianii TaxID=158850 RepID=D1NZ02_9GAMM|nr:methyltransferase domain protein [Providencia rustigianii DSM 4541]